MFFVLGPSHSGKSTFIKELLRHRKRLLSTDFFRIIYYGPASSLASDYEYHEELRKICPTIEIKTDLPEKGANKGDIYSNKYPKLLILDDLSKEMMMEKSFDEIFLKGSHHQSASIIYTNQNYFGSSGNLNIIRNVTHQVLFNSPDLTQLRNISCKFYSTPSFLESCFDSLIDYYKTEQFIYLLLDLDNRSGFPRNLKVRSAIFPNQNNEIVPLIFPFTNEWLYFTLWPHFFSLYKNLQRAQSVLFWS